MSGCVVGTRKHAFLVCFLIPVVSQKVCQKTSETNDKFYCSANATMDSDTVEFLMKTNSMSESLKKDQISMLDVDVSAISSGVSIPIYTTVVLNPSISTIPSGESRFVCNLRNTTLPIRMNTIKAYDAGLVVVELNAKFHTFGLGEQVHSHVHLRAFRGKPTVAIFQISEKMISDGHGELSFRISSNATVVTAANATSFVTATVFQAGRTGCLDRFGFSSPFCANLRDVSTCLDSRVSVRAGNAEVYARYLSASASSTAKLTLTTYSSLRLSAGTWFVLLRPSADFADDAVPYTVSLEPPASRWPLWISAFVMFIMPIAILALLKLLDFVLLFWQISMNRRSDSHRNFIARPPSENHARIARRLVIDAFCWRSHDGKGWCRILLSNVVKSFAGYPGVVLLAGGSLFTAGLQMAMGIWSEMAYTGKLDMCYYNFECYLPWGLDIPLNNMLSHIPYVTTGFLSVYIVASTEYNLERKLAQTEHNLQEHLKVPDLRALYALGFAVVLEAFGSIGFHICPTNYVFQYDASMMYIITLLTMVTLMDTNDKKDRPELQRQDSAIFVPSHIGLMLLVGLPMWIISSIGTWFDFIIPFPMRGFYIAYSIFVLCWFSAVAWFSRLVFPAPSSRRFGGLSKTYLLAIAVVFLGITGVLFTPFYKDGEDFFKDRKESGGMSNILLGYSILFMTTATIRQMILHHSKAERQECRSCSWWASVLILPIALVIIIYVALCDFLNKTTDVLTTPAESRKLNQQCVLLGTFDRHDVWHMLSAVGLGLLIQMLLAMRVRIWYQMRREIQHELHESPEDSCSPSNYYSLTATLSVDGFT